MFKYRFLTWNCRVLKAMNREINNVQWWCYNWRPLSLCSDLEDLWQWALENYFNSPQNLYIVGVNRNLRPIKLVKQGPAHPAGHRRSIDISRRLPNSRMSTIDGYKIHWTTNHKLNLNGDFQVIKVHLKYSIIYYFQYYYSKIDIKVSSTIISQNYNAQSKCDTRA